MNKLKDAQHKPPKRLRSHIRELLASPRWRALTTSLAPYAALIRLNRPIGVLLLLWPTITALWIAAEGLPALSLLFIFTLGTFLLRSAGCCINDFADAHLDGSVERTRNRPLATGALSRLHALAGFLLLGSLGFLLVLFTNRPTILLALVAVPVVAIYPFMKRYTSMPQVVLGLAFSWGILMTFTAQTGAIPQVAWLLFVANILWTVAYDTEYAMADREFDIQLGIKSTAILFGTMDRLIIGSLQLMFLFSLWLAGRQLELGGWFTLALLIAAVLFGYQQYLIRGRLAENCFRAFLNNNYVGMVVFVGVVVSYF
ncbi:MAG: 4-hydroxybenzoate octaprenyltransferase [Pseudohongiellaceae bacterium]